MAWFDDPDEYYGPGDENTAIAQGDIVITPTATLFLGEGEPDAVAPELGEHRTVRLWRGADHDHVVAAPTLSAEVGWALAMVIPHNCAMEKDWNERVAELVASGASQGEAEQQAGSDTGLDPLVTVAPILPYAGLSAKRERSIRSGLRLSAFPVVGNGQVPEGFVDLTAMTCVHYTLVLVEQRVAAVALQRPSCRKSSQCTLPTATTPISTSSRKPAAALRRAQGDTGESGDCNRTLFSWLALRFWVLRS